jgi:hypothetical protein
MSVEITAPSFFSCRKYEMCIFPLTTSNLRFTLRTYGTPQSLFYVFYQHFVPYGTSPNNEHNFKIVFLNF